MERILVVDDEEGITMVIRTVLTCRNYTVVTARNGRDALEKLSLSPIDLVITDMIMPDIDGLHLIPEIHRLYPKIKVIAMSGGGLEFGSEMYLKEARRLGAIHLLAKPFLLNDLVDIVAKTLAESRVRADFA